MQQNTIPIKKAKVIQDHSYIIQDSPGKFKQKLDIYCKRRILDNGIHTVPLDI